MSACYLLHTMTIKMKVVDYSETSVYICLTTRRSNLEYSTLHNNGHEDHHSRIDLMVDDSFDLEVVILYNEENL